MTVSEILKAQKDIEQCRLTYVGASDRSLAAQLRMTEAILEVALQLALRREAE